MKYEESLISFETAKLAKEKEFGYDFEGTDYVPSFYCEENNIETLCKSEMQIEDACRQDHYLRPTQSLLQKWIREEYDIIVTVYANASGYCYELHYSPIRGGTHIKDSEYEGPNDSGCWNVYEDALEAGLQVALKLIISNNEGSICNI